MAIAGIIILTAEGKADHVLEELQEFEGLTSYGIHKENNIVAALDTPTSNELKKISLRIKEEIPDIIDIYPSCIYYEENEIAE